MSEVLNLRQLTAYRTVSAAQASEGQAMLGKRAGDRYATAEEMAFDL